MRRKIIRLGATLLLVAVLVLASCAPAPSPTPTPTPTPTPKPSPGPTTPTPTVETPKYGGVLVSVWAVPPTGFDEARGPKPWTAYGIHLTNEELLIGDWAKGPSGTNEISWSTNCRPPLHTWVGCLAESWELSDPQTLVFHIRKGVYWHNKPPVNGRELTAYDILFTVKRNFELPTAHLYINFLPEQRPLSLTAPDKWTFVVKCPPGQTGPLLDQIGDVCRITAPEVIEKYGDMMDWRNVIGTGPFILVDYVPQSTMTFVRNPNYWGKDPLHPENRLPYLDSVKWLIVEDASTRIAALRTAKVDRLPVLWEEAISLRKTNPELKEAMILAYAPDAIYLRADMKPFSDIRVRRALAMAIDRPAIVKNYYGGNAEILTLLIMPLPEFMDMYTPLKDLPQSTRELYECYPDKAKQLLAEAGYPNGFKTEIVCYAAQVDLLSVVKDYWSRIGVDLTLDIKEYGVWNSIAMARRHKQLIIRYLSSAMPEELYYWRTGTIQNCSFIDDPYINEQYRLISANWFNEKAYRPMLKELNKYILDKCWVIQMPAPYEYVMWQPWLKGYKGETTLSRHNAHAWPKYVWIDQGLKEKITGRR